MDGNFGKILLSVLGGNQPIDTNLVNSFKDVFITFFNNRSVDNIEELASLNPELMQKVVKNLLNAAGFNERNFNQDEITRISNQLNGTKFSITELLNNIKDNKLKQEELPLPIQHGNYRKDNYISALIGIKVLNYESKLFKQSNISAEEKLSLSKNFNIYLSERLANLDASLKEIENKEVELQYIDTIKRNVFVTDEQAKEVLYSQKKHGSISGDNLNEEYKKRGFKTHYKIIEEKLEKEFSTLTTEERKAKYVNLLSDLVYLDSKKESLLASIAGNEQEITPKNLVELLVKLEVKPKIAGLPEKPIAPLISEMRSKAISDMINEVEHLNSLEDVKYIKNNNYQNSIIHRAVYALNKGQEAFRAEFGNVTFQYLLDTNSEKINSFNSYKQTPLSICNNQKIRKALVMNGASVDHAKNLDNPELKNEKNELVEISKKYQELTENVKLSIVKLFQKYANSKEKFASEIVNQVKETMKPDRPLAQDDEKAITVKSYDLHDELATQDKAINKLSIVDKFVNFLKKFMGNDKFTTYAREASEELSKAIKGNFTKQILAEREDAKLNKVKNSTREVF